MPFRAASIRRLLTPVLCTAAAALISVHRFGYSFGASDQEEFLPWLSNRLNPEAFSNDWFVALQSGAFNVRSAFVWLLDPIAQTIAIEPAVMLVYAISFLAIGTAVFALGAEFGSAAQSRLAAPSGVRFSATSGAGSSAASAVGTGAASGKLGHVPAGIAIVVVLAVTPQWTLGGNDLVHSMLVPSMAAWGAGLWAVVMALRRRPVAAAVLTASAGWLQLLVGFHVGAAVLAAFAVRRLWRASGLFAATALAGIAPMVFLLWTASPGAGGGVPGAPDLFYILAEFRAPHHYLPSAFPLGAWVRTAWVLAAAGFALHRVRRTWAPDTLRFVVALVTACVVAILVGAVATEIFRSWPVTLLQPSKQTVLLKAVGITVFLSVYGPLLIRRVPEWVFRREPWVMLLGIGWLSTLHTGGVVSGPDERLSVVSEVTPNDAVFLIPPSLSDFRYGAQRAAVVDFKAVPFGNRATRDWYERLSDVAAVSSAARWGTAKLLPALDHAHESLSTIDLRALGARYDAEFVLRRTPLSGAPALVDGPFYVYAIADLP